MERIDRRLKYVLQWANAWKKSIPVPLWRVSITQPHVVQKLLQMKSISIILAIITISASLKQQETPLCDQFDHQSVRDAGMECIYPPVILNDGTLDPVKLQNNKRVCHGHGLTVSYDCKPTTNNPVNSPNIGKVKVLPLCCKFLLKEMTKSGFVCDYALNGDESVDYKRVACRGDAANGDGKMYTIYNECEGGGKDTKPCPA